MAATCEQCNTVLPNAEIAKGSCEACGKPIMLTSALETPQVREMPNYTQRNLSEPKEQPGFMGRTLKYAWQAALFGGLGGLLIGLRMATRKEATLNDTLLWGLGLGLFLAVAMFIVGFFFGFVKNLFAGDK